MNTLKLNSQGPDVIFLQARLGLGTDGVFGPNTDKAVKEYQKSLGLVQDGVVGPKTWATFGTPTLTEADYEEAAKLIGCDVAAVKAVKTVESAGKAFVEGIRPTILFEGHVFWKQLKARGINPAAYKNYSDVLYPTWDKKKYKGGVAEYARLEKAWTIHPTAAMESASMGMFQIMGNNYKLCGESGAKAMWAHACLGEKEMLMQFCKFVINRGIAKYLINHDWAKFAYYYNGSGYAKNAYDQKLKKAYDSFKK